MMHFQAPRADAELLAELREVGLLTPENIERIDLRMGRPESGRLDDFLLAGAEDIPAADWIAWLIRRHGCHRFGPVRWNESCRRAPELDPGDSPNLPYGICRDGGLLVAVLRPDLRDALEKRRLAPRLLWAAATLKESTDLRAAWSARKAGPSQSEQVVKPWEYSA
jgi:hypothetical protein